MKKLLEQMDMLIHIQLKTEKMKAEERLKIYKKALLDYRRATYLGWWFAEERRMTEFGFCHYFCIIRDIYVYGDGSFTNILPELHAQKPLNASALYWFSPGDRKSRIKCLKAAIKLTKKSIKGEVVIMKASEFYR